jgi:hypothetical protein
MLQPVISKCANVPACQLSVSGTVVIWMTIRMNAETVREIDSVLRRCV